MVLSRLLLTPTAVRIVLVTVAVLLALGAQAGTVITSMLNVGLAAPQRPIHEEHEERADHGRKAGIAKSRGRDGLPEPTRATASRLRLPIPMLTPRTPLPAGVLPDHESDFQYGLGTPLRC